MQPVPLEHGEILETAIADPGAGNQFSYALANHYRYEINCIKFRLTTDATVTNRYPGIYLFTATFQSEYIISPQAIPASQVFDCVAPAGLGVTGFGASNRLNWSLPSKMLVNGSGSIVSDVRNLQAADTITDIYIRLFRWPMRTV